MNLQSEINNPFKYKGKEFPSRLHLAPMAGLGHIAYRELLDYYGGFGLMFTEMCSARALPSENPSISKVFRWRLSELEYLICQIFGAEPGEMANAAKRIEDEGFFGVDINFGCSASGICKKGAGAAVLKEPKRAYKIVKAVRDAVSIPVSVKYRTGWEDDSDIPVKMAKIFEDAGADLLTFHPRVAPDRRTRRPKWNYIKLVKEAVSIPVLGNGDVFSEDDCTKMFRETGCDGISLGRIAIARPFIFEEFSSGEKFPDTKYYECIIKMTDLLEEHYEEVTGVKLFKKFIIYYAANFKYGHAIYKKFINCFSYEELRETAKRVFEVIPEVTRIPNLFMFV